MVGRIQEREAVDEHIDLACGSLPAQQTAEMKSEKSQRVHCWSAMIDLEAKVGEGAWNEWAVGLFGECDLRLRDSVHKAQTPRTQSVNRLSSVNLH